MMITDALISHIEKESDKFSLVDNLNSSDKLESSMTSIILSYTNPAFLSSRPEIIRQMYRLGFRALTLKNNSEVGENNAVVINEEIISEANRLNMIINCSGFDHGLFDLSINSKLILSNIGCYSICPNPRNISDNSLEKVKTALIALNYIFKEGFRYQKSGIILSGLSNVEGNENLFSSVKENKIKSLMKSIDYTNHKYGRSTLSLADAGFRKKPNLRKKYFSKIDTADFCCLPTVKAI